MPGRYSSLTLSGAVLLLSLQLDAHGAPQKPCTPVGDVKGAQWRADCDAAVAQESDAKQRATLLFGRAYVAVDQFRYDDALKDLDAALAAAPDNPDYLRERAYVRSENSDFAAAITDLDRVIQLQPDEPGTYSERAHARHFSGDLQGAYQDRSRQIELQPDQSTAFLGRSNDALWLGRFDDAVADVSRAAGLAQGDQDPKTLGNADELLGLIKRWREMSPGGRPGGRCTMQHGINQSTPPTIIGDCTRVFLDAKEGAAKADALTTRSVAWQVLANSQSSSTEDLRLALAFDPGNIERRINLGYSYIAARHSWAARREFDRALATGNHWLALAGRAAARMNLGDAEGARADALASEKLHPNEPARRVLKELGVANPAKSPGKKYPEKK
jgi:tetratricopeptide (TPR) repeat protein